MWFNFYIFQDEASSNINGQYLLSTNQVNVYGDNFKRPPISEANELFQDNVYMLPIFTCPQIRVMLKTDKMRTDSKKMTNIYPFSNQVNACWLKYKLPVFPHS